MHATRTNKNEIQPTYNYTLFVYLRFAYFIKTMTWTSQRPRSFTHVTKTEMQTARLNKRKQNKTKFSFILADNDDVKCTPLLGNSAAKQNEIRESEGEGERREQNIVIQSSTHFLPPERTEVLMCRRRKLNLEHMLIAHSHLSQR